MRDLLFLSIFTPITLLSLVHPWSGLLAFGWIAFLKPQSLIWPFAIQIPFSLIIAVTTAIGWVFSKEKKTFQLDLTLVLLIALVAIAAISTAYSLMPDVSQIGFNKLIKTTAFLLLLRVMLTSRVRLHSYIWLMAFAMGFFSLSGGTLFILSAGDHQLSGPAQSEIVDRHHLALAMLLSLPLMNYLRLQSRHRWMQICLIGAMVITVMAVLATYSLAGFVGLLAMGLFLLWKSNSRIAALATLLLVAVGLFSVAPDSWKGRAGVTEATEMEDNSFKLQLLSWQTYATAVVDRPLTGAGLDALKVPDVFLHYAPDPEEADITSVRPSPTQSIYLQVLGDLGVAGFIVYIALIVTGFWNAHWISQETRDRLDLEWMTDLGRMIQVSMIAFCVSGAALSMAFYDYFLSLLIVLAAVRQMALSAVVERKTKRVKRPEHSQQPVDTSAIAGIWQKAAATKVTRLRGHRPGQKLVSRGGLAK